MSLAFDSLDPGAHPLLTGLPGGAAAFALSQMGPGPRLVVCPEPADADVLVAALRFWLGAEGVYLLPADDVAPYDSVSPHPELVRRRILALDAVRQRLDTTVVAPARALLPRVMGAKRLAAAPTLCPGSRHAPAALAAWLADAGYLSVGRVEDAGTFSLRGDLLDVWPTGLEKPVRVEFFDDEVESTRPFEPGTQRSVGTLDAVRLLPARELFLDSGALADLENGLVERVEQLGFGERLSHTVRSDLHAGIRFSGAGLFLPLAGGTQAVSEAMEGIPWVVLNLPGTRKALERAAADQQSRFEKVEGVGQLVDPASRWAAPGELEEPLAGAQLIEPIGFLGEALDLGCRENTSLYVERGELAPVAGRLHAWCADGWRVALVVESRTRADRLGQLLRPHGIELIEGGRDPVAWTPGKVQLVLGHLPAGFHCDDAALAVVTADEIFREKVHVRQPTRRFAQASEDASLQSFSELEAGDLVVHKRHGIGRFEGMVRLDLGSGEEELVQLTYRGEDRLYLPVHGLDALARFRSAGEGKDPRLDRLGGETFSARCARVRDAVLAYAHEIVSLQAQRQIHPGHAYAGRSPKFVAFEESFPYLETPDQSAAIDAVMEDLADATPMDRLVVGDVGFGKTEVALRAAMRVAEEGRQVAILCPTTVLAYQHLQTFRERMEPFGVCVDLLSRFRTAAEKRDVIARTAAGEVDVLIGTSGLLGRQVKFPDLGLVVLDEEHRFGVRQKEQLKRLRTEVDMLALSATPIPRSLHMALSDLRSFSLVATPPRDRLPIRTTLVRHAPDRIRAEVLRELQRGGQVFFVHNRVSSIEAVADDVRAAVPEARVVVAHGQMESGALEEVLVEFIQGKFNVLVCSAIIESGVDLPNVNTILVNRADQFGLAQLHQLRGRVGRSHLRGYCTLLVDEGTDLSSTAIRRLRTLQEHTSLGAGFAIASVDLEIRGAGSLLGHKQHGHIEAVGFETYMELLEEALAEARGESRRSRLEPEVNLPESAYLPEAWMPLMGERLGAYKRLAIARSVGQVREVAAELEDRFGEAPLPALALARLHEIRVECRRLGIARCDWLQVRCLLEFTEDTIVSAEHLVGLARELPARMKMQSPTRLEVRFSPEEGKQPYAFLHWVFRQLERSGSRRRPSPNGEGP